MFIEYFGLGVNMTSGSMRRQGGTALLLVDKMNEISLVSKVLTKLDNNLNDSTFTTIQNPAEGRYTARCSVRKGSIQIFGKAYSA